MNHLPRVIVLWIPDWPIHAFLAENGHAHPTPPLALMSRQRVIACSPTARAEGVRIGQRERDAQSLCPQLHTHVHDPDVDERHFLGVLETVEHLVPGIESIRPGLCAMRARGPARYFGSEAQAAHTLLRRLQDLGYDDVRAGIACGKFAAEQVARATPGSTGLTVPMERVHLLPEEHTVPFLSTLPVTRACAPELADTLRGLGIHTLGHLAALPEAAVRERFGQQGTKAYRLATAQAHAEAQRSEEITPRSPPTDFGLSIDFEPPLNGTDQLAFACSVLADDFTEALMSAGLVCTELRIELTDDTGVRHEREWAHPRQFDSAEVLGRLRWQSSAMSSDPDRGGAGIVRVVFVPTRTDRAAAHEPGLWNSEPDTRVHHHLQRVQAMLGHEAVGVAELTGGRLSHERIRFVPWGTRPASGARERKKLNTREGPWPGHLLDPLPSTVFATPLPASLTDSAGHVIGIDAADLLTTAPRMLRISEASLQAPVVGWSAPWPLREKWWISRPPRFRVQITLQTGEAWLLIHEQGTWFAEGRYD